MELNSRIYIAGHRSAVGQALIKLLQSQGYSQIITIDKEELDLRDKVRVAKFFCLRRPEYVFLLAARANGAGDVQAHPVAAFLDNSMIQCNVIECSVEFGVKGLVFFSSDSIICSNGKFLSEYAMVENSVLNTIDPYALAKLCGTRLCTYYNQQLGQQKFISLVPCYIYGGSKGLVYALMAELYAKRGQCNASIALYGSQSKLYQFIHCIDVAQAAVLLMRGTPRYDSYFISGSEYITKMELVHKMAELVGFTGKIITNPSFLTGPEKLTSSKRLEDEGWKQTISLQEGLYRLYRDSFS